MPVCQICHNSSLSVCAWINPLRDMVRTSSMFRQNLHKCWLACSPTRPPKTPSRPAGSSGLRGPVHNGPHPGSSAPICCFFVIRHIFDLCKIAPRCQTVAVAEFLWSVGKLGAPPYQSRLSGTLAEHLIVINSSSV